MPDFINVTNTHGDTQRIPDNWLDLFPGQFTVPDDEPTSSDLPEGDPTKDWTIAQLEAYARDHGVDVTGAKKKADLLTAIEQAADAAPQDPPADSPVLDTTTHETPAAGDKE